MLSGTIELNEATHESDYATAKKLFLEYAEQLGVDLSFQDFHTEIENVKTAYSAPSGAIILARNSSGTAVGCFAIRRFEDSIGELKRMYLRKEFQGQGVGKMMIAKSLDVARQLGYKKLRLDTLPTMHAAIKLYNQCGFYEIPAYRYNPIGGTRYFEIQL